MMQIENNENLPIRSEDQPDFTKTIIEEIENEKMYGRVEHLVYIPEGNHHLNFEVHFKEKTLMIARAQLQVDSDDPQLLDSSIEREHYLYDLLAETEARVPTVHALVKSADIGDFLLLEFMEGKHWVDYIEDHNYRIEMLELFLEKMGEAVAAIHKIEMPSFGNLMIDGIIEPLDVLSYPEHLRSKLQEQLTRPQAQEVFDPEMLKSVEDFVNKHIDDIDSPKLRNLFKPHLTLGDHHPSNVKLDQDGNLSFFDLETCQAGTAAEEFYLIRAQFCSYFYEDEEAYRKANDALKRGYLKNGGSEAVFSPPFASAELILSIITIFSAVVNYRDRTDSIRETWSSKFRKLLLSIIDTGHYNPLDYAKIVSSKTNQPGMASR